MMTRRVALGLAVLALVVAAIYWVATTDHQALRAIQGSKLAAASSAPAKATLVAKKPANRESSKRAPASIFRKPIHVVADDGTAAVPWRYQLDGVARVQTGQGFEDWMSHFSAADQKVLRAFNQRHFGVYQGRSPLQIAWMAAKGYPMPEDVLAAQLMSAVELRNMAKGGNIKAAFLLRDRGLTEIAQKMQAHDKSYGDVLEDNPQLAKDANIMSPKIMASNSPYRAFLKARDGALAYHAFQGSADSAVIGALVWAEVLGDADASERIDAFIRASPSARAREHRKSVRSGAVGLFTYMSLGQVGQLPNVDCIKLILPDDPYPYTPPDTDH